MRQILADIQSGAFAKDWVLENWRGQVGFKALRAGRRPSVRGVSGGARGMMPWITAKRLVDSAKNYRVGSSSGHSPGQSFPRGEVTNPVILRPRSALAGADVSRPPMTSVRQPPSRGSSRTGRLLLAGHGRYRSRSPSSI